jgi:excisionase family DNA binding protein
MTEGESLKRLAEEIAGLRKEVRQLRDALASPPPFLYLTARELAQMFQVSYETVRRRVAAGEWPAVMIGRQARFGPEEICNPGEPDQARPGTADEQLGTPAAE